MAITPAFTFIPNTDIDPDSPVTTTLMTALRNNDEHLEKWLGESATLKLADHSHRGFGIDGTAPVESVIAGFTAGGPYFQGDFSVGFNASGSFLTVLTIPMFVPSGVKFVNMAFEVDITGGSVDARLQIEGAGGTLTGSSEVWSADGTRTLNVGGPVNDPPGAPDASPGEDKHYTITLQLREASSPGTGTVSNDVFESITWWSEAAEAI